MPEVKKIVSINPGGNFGSSVQSSHILWPCRMFSVTMPSRSKSKLNVLETCILRLCDTEAGSTGSIAGLLCPDTEQMTDFKALVSFIQDRLSGMKLLTENYELTEDGRNELGRTSGDMTASHVFTVLVDEVTGSLLEHIHAESFQFLEVREDKGKFIDFLPSSQNRDKYIEARRIPYVSKSVSLPKPADILRLLKRIKRHNLGGSDIPLEKTIIINPMSERIYLHCMVLLPESGGDFIVTNGFGQVSNVFRNALINMQGNEWLAKLRTDAQTGRFHRTVDGSIRKVQDYMSGIRSKLDTLTAPIRSTSELHANTETSSGVVRSIYADIERALNEALQRSSRRGSTWGAVFGGGQADALRNGEKFRHYASDLGFNVPDELLGLMEIPPGRFRAYDNGGSYDMWTMLALSCAQAKGDALHPLRMIARDDPEFLVFIAGLKQQRDKLSHGGTLTNNDADFWETLITRTERALKHLLPGVNFDSDPSQAQTDTDINALSRARAQLEGVFGLAFIDRVKDNGLFSQMLRIEMMLDGVPDDSQCVELVTSMSSCIQLVVGDVLAGNIRDNVNVSLPEIGRKIKAYGFTGNYDPLMKTNTARVVRALKGGSSTLGGCVLALMAGDDESSLRSLAKLCPYFVSTCSRLIELRGHANNWNGEAGIDELRELRNKVYDIMKIFEEAF